MAIITIISGSFCSGEEIAKRVADGLDCGLIGSELVEEAAQRFGTSTRKLSRAMSGGRTLFNSFTRDYERSVVYITAALADMLSEDNLVYHGAAAHLIPSRISHVLKVGLVAGIEFRQALAMEQGVEAKEAASRIAGDDRDLADWTQQHLSSGPWDPELYDLRISLSTTSVADAVDLILKTINNDALRPTEKSRQAERDFVLAARVNLALLERGQYHADVTADQGKVMVKIRSGMEPKGAFLRSMQSLRLDNQRDEALKICSSLEGVESAEVEVLHVRRTARTLLVDDEQDFVTTLSERLQKRDIPTDIAFDGEQALSLVEENEPRVMVLDLKMPGIDGIEVLRRIKREHAGVAIIVLTGHGSALDEKLVRELGAFAYLEKPVKISTLVETIKEATEASKDTGDEG